MRRSKISLTVDQRFEGLERRIHELEKDLRNKSNHIDRLEAQILDKLSLDTVPKIDGFYWAMWLDAHGPGDSTVIEVVKGKAMIHGVSYTLDFFKILSPRLEPPPKL